MINWINLNKAWIFDGVGALILVSVLSYAGKKIFGSNKLEKSNKDKNIQNNNQTQNISINNILSDKGRDILVPDSQKKVTDVAVLKTKTKILFIDDVNFKNIANLKNSGWNVSRIKDVTNLDDENVRTADIIFIDFKGVGRRVSDEQGIGLVKALKSRYGDKKWLIFYSAHDVSLDVFDIGADDFLTKNSQVYEMEQKIIHGATHISQ